MPLHLKRSVLLTNLRERRRAYKHQVIRWEAHTQDLLNAYLVAQRMRAMREDLLMRGAQVRDATR